MAGMGTAIWLMARLCRTTLRHPLLLVAGAAFWNLGVLLGVGGILAGDSTGYQWLEFPPYAAIVLFVAYSLVMSWAMLMFRFRRGEQIYITQWYLLGAFLWFPWLYGAAQIMLFVVPVQGVMQAAVNWWFANNLLFLWFGAIGLGTAYYMIPKVIGRPVYSYHLAAIGFWTYALFASWTGMQRLVDGPFPAWMITASIAATILTIIPVATVGLNHHMTMRGYFRSAALQPDAALHRFRRDCLTRCSACRRVDFAPIGGALRPFHRGQHRLFTHWVSTPSSPWSCSARCITSCRAWSAANGATLR